MASSVEPRSGINHSWTFGESGWNTGMDANLLSIGRYAYHLSVKDRDLSVPPGSPVAGDAYIVGPSATGDWATHDDDVTVWDGADWVFGTPRLGWVAYIEDEGVHKTFTSSWVDVVGAFTSLDVAGAGTFGGSIDASAGGVYLGGTAAANLLDYHEKGIFTPTFEASSGSGATYSSQIGVYTKTGNLVTIHIDMKLTGIGTLSGSAFIKGLPFAPLAGSNNGSGSVSYWATWATAVVAVECFCDNTNMINLLHVVAAQTSSVFTSPSVVGASGRLILSLTYTTA